MSQPRKLTVSPAAMRFSGRVKFDAPTQPAECGQRAPVPISVLARTGEPIYHWWWGWIVHDMAGFTAAKESIVFDWCHCDDEIMGVATAFDASNDGLTVSGKLTPFCEDDRASEVIFKSANDVPYEASIDWSGPCRIEELTAGAKATVNGQTIVGPAYIVREWSVSAVAICPHGADSGTAVQFQGNQSSAAEVEVSIFRFSHEGDMAQNPGSVVPPGAAGAQTQTFSRDELLGQLKRFTDAFGPEKGQAHFHAGKQFSEAVEVEFGALKAELTEAKTKFAAELKAAEDKHAAESKKWADEKAEFEKQIALFKKNSGEQSPLSFSSADGKDSSTPGATPDAAVAKLAATIKLPGAKT